LGGGVSLRPRVVGAGADEPNRSAVAIAAKLLVNAGHSTVRAEPRYTNSLGLEVLATWFAATYRKVEGAGLDRSALQTSTRRHASVGRWFNGRGLADQRHRDAWRESSIEFFADRGIDVLLTPALAQTPPAAGGHVSAGWAHSMRVNVRYAPFAAPWNFAGLPAIVVPVGVRPDGLPLAVQLVGPPDSELLLLSVAGQFEMQNPWQRLAIV
jgi:amidase